MRYVISRDAQKNQFKHDDFFGFLRKFVKRRKDLLCVELERGIVRGQSF